MQSSLVPYIVLLLFAAFFTFGTAAVLSPACAQECLGPVLAALPCYSNTSTPQELANCFCPNNEAEAIVSICVATECNQTEQYIAGKLGYAWCQGQPIQSRSNELIITVIILSVFTSIFVILRAWSRAIVGYKFGWDDWTLGIAAVAVYAFLAIEVPNAYKGTGDHTWNLNPDNGPDLLKIMYISKIFYIVAQVFTKISLVVFYLRIFPNKAVRIAAWIMFAWLAGHGVVFLLLEIFQCVPIEAVWDLAVPGKCHNELNVFYLGAAASIFEDLYILVLPIPCISSLQMGTGKKVILCFVFAIGSFASVTSIIRLKYLYLYAITTDSTWDGLDLAVWSAVEIASAVICACLPTFRPLLSRYLPKLFTGGSTNRPTTGAISSNYPQFRNTFSHRITDVETATSAKGRKRSGKGSSDTESTEHISRPTRWSNDDEVTELVIIHPENAKGPKILETKETI